MSVALQRALAEAVGPGHVTREGSSYTVQPGAPPEVARVLAIARERRVPVMPIGARTHAQEPAAAAAPGRPKPEILLDTRRMTNLLHLDELSLTVHAQAGIEVRALEAQLNERGLTLGDFPAETYRSTLGGILAARAPGRATSRLGPIESTCIGMQVVLPDGRTVHVKAAPRRATGPDLMRLFLGGEGILGVITAAVVRIQRLPDARIFTSHALSSVDLALDAARHAMRRGARPAAVRIYDGEDAHASGLGEGVDRSGALLLASLTGATAIVDAEARILGAAARDRGGRALGAAPAEAWWSSRGAPASPGELGAPARYQVAAPLGKLAAVYRGVRASLLAAGVPCRAYLAHFHEGGGCAYFAFPRTEPIDAVARESAVAAGGRPADELGVDEPLQAALHTLKQELDPHGILFGGRLA